MCALLVFVIDIWWQLCHRLYCSAFQYVKLHTTNTRGHAICTRCVEAVGFSCWLRFMLYWLSGGMILVVRARILRFSAVVCWKQDWDPGSGSGDGKQGIWEPHEIPQGKPWLATSKKGIHACMHGGIEPQYTKPFVSDGTYSPMLCQSNCIRIDWATMWKVVLMWAGLESLHYDCLSWDSILCEFTKARTWDFPHLRWSSLSWVGVLRLSQVQAELQSWPRLTSEHLQWIHPWSPAWIGHVCLHFISLRTSCMLGLVHLEQKHSFDANLGRRNLMVKRRRA